MENNKILIVDDDPDIREVLFVLLSGEGYLADTASDGMSAIEKIKNQKDFSLIILDIMMPGMTGIDTCSEIRNLSDAPVLFLTAKSGEQDKVEAYTSGGDDYLVKPFSKVELLMKVKALLRRYKPEHHDEIRKNYFNETLFLDEKKKCAAEGEKQIPLTDKEYGILEFFLNHRGEVVEARTLYEGVWNEKYLPSAGNTIMVHILNLRKKLEVNPNKPEIIKTVWGKGYKVE